MCHNPDNFGTPTRPLLAVAYRRPLSSPIFDRHPTLSKNPPRLKKVRVKFVTKDPSIRVTETPVAVPESLQRYGLSEVVNHLLGRDPPTPFDMLVMGRFLRSSLRSVMQRHALSGEAVLEVEYLPALRQPTEAEHADQVLCVAVGSWLGKKIGNRVCVPPACCSSS